MSVRLLAISMFNGSNSSTLKNEKWMKWKKWKWINDEVSTYCLLMSTFCRYDILFISLIYRLRHIICSCCCTFILCSIFWKLTISFGHLQLPVNLYIILMLCMCLFIQHPLHFMKFIIVLIYLLQNNSFQKI